MKQQNVSAFVKNNKPRRRGPHSPTNKARNLREAVILAAEAVGEDGRGHNGVVGYLKNVAVEEPKAYLQLFAKILPMQNIEVNSQPVRYIDEIPPEERRRAFYEEMRSIKLGNAPRLVIREEGQKIVLAERSQIRE